MSETTVEAREAAARSVTVRRLVRATPAVAFAAWTEPEHLRRWASPEGTSVAEVEVDLRVGGAYRILMEGPDGRRYTAFGAYRAIEPPRRLVYTWDWEEEENAVGETLVTVDFHDRGESTEVVITHGGFPGPEPAKGHAEGWESCLNRLETFVAEDAA